MEFALKNVKYAAFASEESHCFQATLYIDGKPFCRVSNDGHGGCDDYQKIKGSPDDLYGEIKSINKELAKEVIESDFSLDDSGTYQLNNDLEIVVGGLMNDWHRDNEVKRILRRVSYLDGNELYQFKSGVGKNTAVYDAIKQSDWWKPEYQILNEMSPADAKAKLTEAGFFG